MVRVDATARKDALSGMCLEGKALQLCGHVRFLLRRYVHTGYITVCVCALWGHTITCHFRVLCWSVTHTNVRVGKCPFVVLHHCTRLGL